MQRPRQSNLACLAALTVFILACALPGPGGPSAPLAGPDELSTIIAGTAAAAAAQTAAIAPQGTPGEILTGNQLDAQSDGSTRYTDYDGGFELVLPAGWLAVRPNSEEFTAALQDQGADNQVLHDQMIIDQDTYESVPRRLLIYTLRPDIEKNSLFGFSRLALDQDEPRPIDQAMLSELVNSLQATGAMPGYRITVAQVGATASGLPLIELSGPYSVDDGQGGVLAFHTSFYFFKPGPNSLVRLSFSILQDFNETIAPDVRSVVDSVQLLGQ
jgi:hypothetical protein